MKTYDGTWKWAHDRPQADDDHKASRAKSSFGFDICRHCGGYVKKVAR